ncbi:MAG: hypothetical protein F4120_08210 [Rhodothermaceae bacterium]|nr:hypothetical protein [Rhodothermaceae bacterium]MYC03274.1 hypothetical protein [Rhodothermaceae bacterium]MYI17588.1 hypothetical protein [Rhodothermaceae bacterium]
MNSAIPVCLEVGHQYRPKAEYSIRMLLGPLGLGPIFQSRSKLGGRGIYYGDAPSGLDPKIIVLPLAPNAEDFFDDFAPLNVASVTWQDNFGCNFPVLFSSKTGDDLVASTFYWLSGWQENATIARDPHGRFPHKESLQAMLNVTHIPVVDCYREVLRGKLVAAGIQVSSKTWVGKKWAFCPTIDVDYLQHWRLGMILREKVHYFLLNHRKVNGMERWRRLFQFIQSYFTPGDAFQTALYRMHRLIRRYGSATVFLKAAAHGPNDVDYRLDQKFLQKMLRDLQSDDFEIGLHPSYHAYAHPGYLRSERRTLTNQIGMPPVSVRQHFLRYDPRITPRLQAEAGFLIDSSLGFSECAGFRNGTCMPFLKFDCTRNEVMDLWEMPLLLMDGVLFNRQNYGVEEAIHESTEILRMCQKFGGVGVALWHNVIGEEMDYPGWGKHFEAIVQWCSEQGAYIGSLRNALSSWRGFPV